MIVETTTHEVCTMEDIGLEITGEDAQPIIDTINEYLSVFAKPCIDGDPIAGNSKCLNCETTLNGLLGSFQWGIANGEGTCSQCGWPARAHHRPKDKNGAIFNHPMEIILQYHPDCVERKS